MGGNAHLQERAIRAIAGMARSCTGTQAYRLALPRIARTKKPPRGRLSR